MKKYGGALCTLTLLAVSLPNLFAQAGQPFQPVDPTAQARQLRPRLLRRRFRDRKVRQSQIGPTQGFIWEQLSEMAILTS
jgi:hypothetical protein